MEPKTAQAATPMAFVQAIVSGYLRRGRDPAGALAAAQIAPATLHQPQARITAAQMERISEFAMRELDDEALGWFERPLCWGSYGLLARASLTAPTLGVALRRWCRHHSLLVSDITLSVATDGDLARLTLTEHADLGPRREFCHISLLRNVLGLGAWLVDSRLPLRSAAFPWPQPDHAAAYGVLFPAPQLTFNAPATTLCLDAHYLDLPLRRDETAMRQMLQHALPLMVQPYRRDRLLVARVREALRNETIQLHSAQALAERLHVSTRTLHRQLRDEGITLQGLKDEVRRDKAMALLLRTRQPVKQVAEACGFLNEKSFSRAFRGWTGLPPGEWRDQQQAASVLRA